MRSLRVNSKRTLEEQSILLGVSLNSVYRWEHELASPKKQLLEKVSEIYGVPFNWLVSKNEAESTCEHESHGGAASQDNGIDAQLLKMFNKLHDRDKYKVLGYIERICVEGMDKVDGGAQV